MFVSKMGNLSAPTEHRVGGYLCTPKAHSSACILTSYKCINTLTAIKNVWNLIPQVDNPPYIGTNAEYQSLQRYLYEWVRALWNPYKNWVQKNQWKLKNLTLLRPALRMAAEARKAKTYVSEFARSCSMDSSRLF